MLKGISLPSLDQVASDALAVLSASPVSVSPDGQLAVVDVLFTNGSAQLHAFLLADLTDGSYATNYNAVIGLGDETSVKSYAAAVTWNTDNTSTLSISYEDLTDNASAGLYNRIAKVTGASSVSVDLVEAAVGVVANGSIMQIISDDSGHYVAFETAATNLSPVGSLDTNTVADVYLLDTQLNTLVRISSLADGTEAFDEAKLQDVAIVDGEVNVLFSTQAAEVFSASDTNAAQDLYLWRAGEIQLVSANSDGEAAGYDGGIAAFVSDEIGFLATDLIDTDVDGLLDLYLANTATLSKRVDAVTDSLAFASDYDLWIEGGNDASIIVGSSGVSQGAVDISNQLLAIDIESNVADLLSVNTSGSLADDMSFAPVLSALGNTIVYQTSATNLVSSLDSLALVVNHTNTTPTGELSLTSAAQIGQAVSVDLTSFADPDGYGDGLAFTWFLDGGAQAGGAGNSFALTSDMEGKALSVTVDYTDNWGAAESISLADAIEIKATVKLSGSVSDRSGNGLSNVTVSVAQEQGGSIVVESYNSEQLNLGVGINYGSQVAVTATKSFQSNNGAITVYDALDALKIAIGLNPSGGAVTGEQLIAADIDKSGDVSVYDALDILKAAIGITTNNPPEWVFINTDLDLSSLATDTVNYDDGARLVSIDADQHFDFISILLGDVDNSFNPPIL